MIKWCLDGQWRNHFIFSLLSSVVSKKFHSFSSRGTYHGFYLLSIPNKLKPTLRSEVCIPVELFKLPLDVIYTFCLILLPCKLWSSWEPFSFKKNNQKKIFKKFGYQETFLNFDNSLKLTFIFWKAYGQGWASNFFSEEVFFIQK